MGPTVMFGLDSCSRISRMMASRSSSMSVASSRPIALVLGSTGSAASGTAMCKHSGLCPQYCGE